MHVCTQTCVHVKVREQLQRLFLKGKQSILFPKPCPPVGLEVTSRQGWLAREPQTSAHFHLHEGYKRIATMPGLFCKTSGDWIQVLVLPRQTLYLLSHLPSPCSLNFQNHQSNDTQITGIISWISYKIRKDQRESYPYFNG